MKITIKLLYFGIHIALLLNSTHVYSQIKWDSVPQNGRYQFVKNISVGENLNIINSYESGPAGKVLTACLNPVNEFNLQLTTQLSNFRGAFIDALAIARKLCQNYSPVLLGYQESPVTDSRPTMEVAPYLDKFTGESYNVNDLYFARFTSDGDLRPCDGCTARIWPNGIVINGYSLIKRGTVEDIPTRLRLGKTIYAGFCKLVSNRSACQLSMNGSTDRSLADMIKNHSGEMAIEFHQQTVFQNTTYDQYDNWVATIGGNRTTPPPRPFEY